ncbi:3-coathanger stack domain-containing protein [Emticicia sp. SJ17W-69]|uniref:3-coathanger stack domain-containing protein n=1 Tax=Emticicia sp. SJ17W-69 TaxID=3421657 RepID=UPI003EBD7624
MKKQNLLLIITLFLSQIVVAQINNNEPIVAAEYFFDNDPGIGNGIQISAVQGDIVTKNIVIPNNLPVGYHLLAVRVKNANNEWSLFQQQNFYVVKSVNALSEIVAAEYFFDSDPGIGNGIQISAVQGEILSKSIAIPSNLPVGYHLLAVRVKNANNEWSLFQQQNFYVVESVNAPSEIVAAEYFFDNDPGIGNGIKLSVTQAGEIVNQAISIQPSFPVGQHLFSVRVKNGKNLWSLQQVFEIIVRAPSPQCADAINLQSPTDDFISVSTIKQTNNIITANNKISGSSNVIFRSAKSILLTPANGGFRVASGSIFKAEIGGCQ